MVLRRAEDGALLSPSVRSARACEIIQEAAFLRGRLRLPADPVRRGSARQARAVAGRSDTGRDPDRVAGGRHDRPGPGTGALYAETWSVECGFRDGTDIRFGMGMGAVRQ